MTAFVCPSYHPTARVSDLSFVLYGENALFGERVAGLEGEEGEGEDDRVTG